MENNNHKVINIKNMKGETTFSVDTEGNIVTNTNNPTAPLGCWPNHDINFKDLFQNILEECGITNDTFNKALTKSLYKCMTFKVNMPLHFD